MFNVYISCSFRVINFAKKNYNVEIYVIKLKVEGYQNQIPSETSGKVWTAGLGHCWIINQKKVFML